MPDFRILIVGPDGRFAGSEVFVAADTEEAIAVALKHAVNMHRVALWQGEEWIGSFEPGKKDGSPYFTRVRRK